MDIEGAEYNLLPCLAQFKDAGGAKFDGFIFNKASVCFVMKGQQKSTHDELI